MSRIQRKLEKLRSANRAAFVPFIMAGDPDAETSAEILRQLPAAGADMIELGICFTDPMADGPVIELAGQRALAAGQTLSKTLEMVATFRETDTETPIILMGYYNPIYAFGPEKFVKAAKSAGVDGLIVVDLPPEEDPELCMPARTAALDFIRLATPTTDTNRLPDVARNTSGFIYYVSVRGITGGKTGANEEIDGAVTRLREATKLPVAVGFGVKTPEKAATIARVADAVVVGSALVEEIEKSNDPEKKNPRNSITGVISKAKQLADAVHAARI